MTEHETRSEAVRPVAGATADDEDARLADFGYTQRLDRSIGPLASFAIGFATISATTAVFTGFGAGFTSAGGPFVWTLLIAGAVFAVWTMIAAISPRRSLSRATPTSGRAGSTVRTWAGSPARSRSSGGSAA